MATQQERAVVDLVINGQQAKTSLRDVSLEATRAYSALSKMHKADDPKAYAEKVEQYQKLAGAQAKMRAEINGTSSAWSRFKANMASTAMGVLGGNLLTSTLSAIPAGISKAISSYREFNAASQELSAVTGATGQDLEFLNQQARKLGPDMGKSGAEMLEAFKLMASAKPELLEQKELLVETTKAAITLSQAGKIDLAEATRVTAESLNQFGESADQANRFINVIAAGAKEGSAEINEMGMALKASGTVAASQNVSFEQTNAVLQSLSTIALKGEQAGTMFRNVLLTLGSGADETNPKVVGLDKALDNLAKQNLNTAELTKLFGKENIIAAQHILEHRDEIGRLTEKVTGTQEAFTQAAKNNQTLDHQLEQFWSLVEGLAVSLGTKLAPALSQVVTGATNLIKNLPQMAQWLSKNGEWLLITGIPALVLYNASLIKATASAAANTVAEIARRVAFQVGYSWLLLTETATKAYALATGVLTGQISIQTAVVTIARGVWAAFSAVLLANPIGLVVAAMGGLIAAAKYFSEHTQRAIDLERKKQAIQKQGVKDHQLATQAQQEINDKLAHFNELSKAEQDNLQRTIALKQQETRARLQAALARSREIARQEADPTFWQGMKQGAADFLTGNWGNLSGSGLEQQRKQQAEANKASAYAEAKNLYNVEQLQADLAEFDRQMQQTKPHGQVNGGGAGNGLTEDQKKAAKKKLADAKRDADELERLLSESRGRIMDGERTEYEREVSDFAERYSKMYALAGSDEKKLNQIREQSLLEWGNIEKRYRQKQSTDRAQDLKAERDQALESLKTRRDIEQAHIEAEAGRGVISDDAARMGKLQAEAKFLMATKLLYTQYYKDIDALGITDKEKSKAIKKEKADFEKDIQNDLTKNVEAQIDARLGYAMAADEKERELALQRKAALMNIFQETLSLMQVNWTEQLKSLKDFWSQASVVQKAAFIASKAYSVAEATLAYSRTLMNIWATSGSPWAAVGFTALATATYGTVLGKIASTNYSTPAFADGGFTGMTDGPAGFVDGPTLFQMGQRRFIAGEAGREFVISNKALQNPVVADFARMMDVAQKTGNFGILSGGGMVQLGAGPAMGGALPAGPGPDSLLVVSAINGLHEKIDDLGKRPIVNNYRLTEQYAKQVQQIRQENTL